MQGGTQQRSAGCTVISIFSIITLLALAHVGRPVYWRLQAEYLRPFRSGATELAIGAELLPPGSAILPLNEPEEPSDSGPDSTIMEPALTPEPSPAHPPPPPPPVDPRAVLTRERVQKLAQEGYLLVTWANYHYLDFVLSWVYHVREAGITGYMVGAMDEPLMQELLQRGIPAFSIAAGLTTKDFGWGSPSFAKMGRHKIRLIPQFLDLGVQVIVSDVDVAWVQNPIPFFQRYPQADILTSSDHLTPTVEGAFLERWPNAGSAANIGIMLFRNASMAFVQEWISIIEADDKIWDQNAFNDLFKRGAKALPGDTQNIFQADNGKLRMGILPVSLFCSGHTYFVQRLYKRLGVKPYAVHATFQFSGTPGKRHRLREGLLWRDEPGEYFDPPGGLLSFRNSIPGNILGRAGPRTGRMEIANVEGHFRLVNLQIARVRQALAVAQALGRTLVMPELWCGVDRYWAPHTGHTPGSSFKLPFKCPMDHIFDLEGGWTKDLPSNQFGPPTPFREHSFFRNGLVQPTVYRSKAIVTICPPGTADCSDGSFPAPLVGDTVKVQAGLKSDKLQVALSAVAGSKVLQFSTMDDAFGGFADAGQQERFNNRMKLYGSLWCCVNKHPGHVHYDMLWDQPHTDRFKRPWNKGWNITTGP